MHHTDEIFAWLTYCIIEYSIFCFMFSKSVNYQAGLRLFLYIVEVDNSQLFVDDEILVKLLEQADFYKGHLRYL